METRRKYLARLRKAFPELEMRSYKSLREELKELQANLSQETIAVGTANLYLEQALIAELERRDNQKLK